MVQEQRGPCSNFLSHIYSIKPTCLPHGLVATAKWMRPILSKSWGHPQSDSLGSYTSSEIGSKLSKHGIHLDRFFRDAHALCTCICVLWAFPKTIDAHSICLWYSVCPMSMPIRPVGIPIMSCGLSQLLENDFSGLEKLDSQISYLFVCFSMLLEHLSWKT